MRKHILVLIVMLACLVSSTCFAFSVDRAKWTNFANTNKIEVFYNNETIAYSGNTAKVWLCYHYQKTDTYRVICKEFTRGSNKTTILKILDYHSDGTFKRGSAKVIPNVALGLNEEALMQKLW